jgi:hypothetical protein
MHIYLRQQINIIIGADARGIHQKDVGDIYSHQSVYCAK